MTLVGTTGIIHSTLYVSSSNRLAQACSSTVTGKDKSKNRNVQLLLQASTCVTFANTSLAKASLMIDPSKCQGGEAKHPLKNGMALQNSMSKN